MSTILPEHILKLMDPRDRATLGRAGILASEAQSRAETQNEKTLAKQIGNLLRLRGIEYFSSRTDRRTTRPVGEPDFLFSVNGAACAWECKTGKGKLSPEQAITLQRLSTPPNCWHVAVIRSVDDARAFLAHEDRIMGALGSKLSQPKL